MSAISFGYNMGYEAIMLGQAALNHHDHHIFNHTKDNDEIIEKMRTIKDAIAMVNNKRRESQTIDHSKFNHSEKELFEKVRAINPNLIGSKSIFKEAEIDALLESMTNEAKQFSNDLNVKTMDITQLFQDRNKIVEVLTKIVETYDEESKHYIRHQTGK